MTLALGTAGDAQLATRVAGVHWLIELDFAAPYGTQYITTAPVDVDAAGATYKGVGSNCQVGSMTESEANSARQLTISFSADSSAVLPLVLGDSSTYRNKRVRLYLQLFDAQFVPVLSRVKRWSGRMDAVRVPRKRGDTGGSSVRIELPCLRSGMPHARNFQGLRLTHAQQLARFPGNLVLQYLQDLLEKPALWLSKAFQEI